jgi:hypothetical protein
MAPNPDGAKATQELRGLEIPADIVLNASK